MSKVFWKGVRGITLFSKRVSPDLERKRQKSQAQATKVPSASDKSLERERQKSRARATKVSSASDKSKRRIKMKKAEKLTRKALAAFAAAALIAAGSACSSNETKQGGADSTTKAAESTAGTSASQDAGEITSAAETSQERIDPATIDVSNVDVTIPFGSGAQIVDFTNDMQAGKYDYKVVKCEGITSRRMTGNAMMQAQDDGTKRGFTWILLDTMNPDDYPPEDAQVEITGVVGIGEYGVRYVYVLPENVVIKTGAAAEESNLSLIKNGVWWSSETYGDTYYIFKEDGTGSLLSQDMGNGVAYNYKFVDNSCTFEMGAVGASITADLSVISENECELKWQETGDTEKLTYYGPTESFDFYSNVELQEMARTWFADKKGLAAADIDVKIDQDKSIAIHLSYLGKDRTPGDYQLNIDRFTGTGKGTDDESIDLTPYFGISGDLGNAFYTHRIILKNENAPVGVRYLGFVSYDSNDFEVSQSYYQELLEKTNTNNEFSLQGDVGAVKFVTTGNGTELYLIIPVDEKIGIEVFKAEVDADTATLKKGESVYKGDGSPFLLKCNVSEIMPDVIIAITDENGDTFEWSPSISGMDGSVMVKNAAGKNIKDFTDYKNLASQQNVPQG